MFFGEQTSPQQMLEKIGQLQKENEYLWVSDITYVATLEGWLYLAVILDLFSPPQGGGLETR
jgi:transposase InsO family protein